MQPCSVADLEVVSFHGLLHCLRYKQSRTYFYQAQVSLIRVVSICLIVRCYRSWCCSPHHDYSVMLHAKNLLAALKDIMQSTTCICQTTGIYYRANHSYFAFKEVKYFFSSVSWPAVATLTLVTFLDWFGSMSASCHVMI